MTRPIPISKDMSLSEKKELRDKFAMAILPVIYSKHQNEFDVGSMIEHVAKFSYMIADQMMIERQE